MVINHNMQAMNAQRQMSKNSVSASNNMEKLSSGLRINRAGDDAAGLSISEKMRGQIRGLNQASRNAQDGISLIQTAEGALGETEDILQRMRELAVQGANDTNVEADRSAITEELTALTSELDRLAQTTQFNEQNLLSGEFKATFQIGANTNQTIDLEIANMGSGALGLSSGAKLDVTVGGNGKLKDGQYSIKGTDVMDAKGNSVGKIDLSKGEITLPDGTNKVTLGHAITDGSTFTINGDKGEVALKGTGTALDNLAAGEYTVSGENLLAGDKLVGTIAGNAANALTLTDGTTINLTQLGLTDADVADGKSFTINGIDVSNASKATGSIKTIDTAIQKVSEQRSKLGATQNRLEYTIKNLGNNAENTQAAESRIRDVDMAKEMMEMTKNNILSQAAQSMLSQANQNPQQVLQLLR